MANQVKGHFSNLDTLITTAHSVSDKIFVKRAMFVDFLNVLAVLVYASFTMNSAMVWVDLHESASADNLTHYHELAVIYWIQFEFIIFVVNLLTIPAYLLVMQFTQWYYGQNRYEGGPRFTVMKEGDYEESDILRRHSTLLSTI